MKLKAKGLNAERELVRMFNEQDWRAVRVAGSGSIKYPAPDVIASNGSRRIVVECKTTKSANQYLDVKQIDELRQFSKALLAEPWVGVRFAGQPWLFVSLEDLSQTNTRYVISIEQARLKGVLFEELIQ